MVSSAVFVTIDVAVSIGIVRVSPTAYYNSYYGRTIKVSKYELAQTALRYKNALRVSLAKKESSIIQLSINDIIPQRAEDILNTLMQSYDDDMKADKNIVLEATKEFISQRIEDVTAELESIDQAAQSYSERHNVVDLSSQTSLSISEAQKYKTEAIGIETQKMLVKSIREYMHDKSRVWEVVPTAGLSDQYIIGAIAEYNEGLLQRRKLLESSSERNPVVQQASSMLNSQRQAILSYVDNLLSQYEVSLRTARAQEAASTKQYMTAPMKLVGQTSIERKQKIKSEQYIYLLGKQEENELGRAVASSESRVIDSAYGSNTPVAPKTTMILLLAFILGCAIPIGIIILLNLLNTTIRGRKDIEDALTIPLLGEVPQSTAKHTKGFLVKENGKDPVSEAFRMLRSNLGFMKTGSKSQVIMITSTNASSGKTFTTLNLSYTLATSGKRVVIIDNDMRKRSLSKQIGGRSVAMGLSKYLSDDSVTTDELINPSKVHANLDVIFAGLQPPNPAELLMSERLEQLIAELRERYDYIIIDSVPALMVADAIIADRVCDLSIYVIREGRMDRRMLPDVQRLADTKRLHNMSVVLNGVRDMSKRYGYGYGYRYGHYGYAYTYSEDEGTTLWATIKRRLRSWIDHH
ncbi:MAG: polysaccharide biosynthesis tyrosine autokinase [Rikenellaceae bacterium]|nr:polysaccharide biosynthesis tyrosine autokinase [Rikenellaceae bacterium]